MTTPLSWSAWLEQMLPRTEPLFCDRPRRPPNDRAAMLAKQIQREAQEREPPAQEAE